MRAAPLIALLAHSWRGGRRRALCVSRRQVSQVTILLGWDFWIQLWRLLRFVRWPWVRWLLCQILKRHGCSGIRSRRMFRRVPTMDLNLFPLVVLLLLLLLLLQLLLQHRSRSFQNIQQLFVLSL